MSERRYTFADGRVAVVREFTPDPARYPAREWVRFESPEGVPLSFAWARVEHIHAQSVRGCL